MKHDDNYDMAIGGSRQHILNSRSYSSREHFCFNPDQNIVSYQPRLLMRMNAPLRSRIDRIIRNSLESGLFEKWKRDSERRKEPKQIEQEETHVLTCEHFLFLYGTVYATGVVMASLSLYSEIIIKRNMMKSPRLRIWMYLEHFFDGNRNYLRNLVEI